MIMTMIKSEKRGPNILLVMFGVEYLVAALYAFISPTNKNIKIISINIQIIRRSSTNYGQSFLFFRGINTSTIRANIPKIKPNPPQKTESKPFSSASL